MKVSIPLILISVIFIWIGIQCIKGFIVDVYGYFTCDYKVSAKCINIKSKSYNYGDSIGGYITYTPEFEYQYEGKIYKHSG